MSGHSLASLALSFLVVGLAAIVFRPAEPGPSGPSIAAETPPPLTDTETEKPSRVTVEPVPRPRLTTASTVKVLPGPLPPGPEADEAVRSPGSAFTQVEPGETLGLVARRVYGTTKARERLWRGNRDLLSDPEAALRPGTILRTP